MPDAHKKVSVWKEGQKTVTQKEAEAEGSFTSQQRRKQGAPVAQEEETTSVQSYVGF